MQEEESETGTNRILHPVGDRQTDESGREAGGLFSSKKQTATQFVFFRNQQEMWRCQQMHNATGRHLVADHQLSTTHTHVYSVCNGAVFFSADTIYRFLCRPPARKLFTPEWCVSIFLTFSLSCLEWGKVNILLSEMAMLSPIHSSAS